MRDVIDDLADRAESERKYWGGESVGLLHLAVAVAKQDLESFTDSFGSDGLDLIKATLRASPASGDEGPQLEEVLAAGRAQSDPTAAVRTVASELRVRLHWIFDSEAPKAAPENVTSAVPAGQKPGMVVDDIAPTGLRPMRPEERELPERVGQVDELVVMLARRAPLVPLLVGREGSGRSTLLRAFASRLGAADYSGPLAGSSVLEVTPEMRAAPNLVYQLGRAVQAAQAAQGTPVVCIEDIEVLLGVSGMGMDVSMLVGLRQLIEGDTAHFVFSVDEALLPQLTRLAPEFVSTLTPLEVAITSAEAISTMLGAAASDLADGHGVDLSSEIVDVAATIKPSHVGPVQPGLGISVMDSACVRATMRGGSGVEVQDLRGTEKAPKRIDHATLSDSLQRSVVGQEHVAERVASRLALTQAGLDLRPERPDGVFLFVGPTGVGKTEMARAVAREVFGTEERLIRLDMSEYVQQWSVTRLIGPHPGYLGSDEPSSWLTTRVMANPRSVLLLDEIEKAHPLVWNTFLQVFDAGRLTDSRGEVADFSDVVVIMTSNLGAEAYSKRQIGFGSSSATVDRAEAEMGEVIRRSLSPELINRLDETLMFRPLEPEHILEIARGLVQNQVLRIAGLGYELTIDDSVVEHLAVTGYEPVYGARHLQRNVDRQLLAPLAMAGEGTRFRASLMDGEVRWSVVGAG